MVLDRLLSENSSSAWAANVRTLSPATDEPEVHSVRGGVLADLFSRNTSMSWVCKTRARNSTFRVCVVFFTGHLCCCVLAGRRRDLDYTVFVRF